MGVGGLVLAAGAGRRYGQPKALVCDDQGSWLGRAARGLLDAGCEPVWVVLGAGGEQAQALVGDLAVEVVLAEHWHLGMSASLRAGLQAATEADEVDAVVVTLVDLSDVGSDVVVRLMAGGVDRSTLRRASYDGMPGHPVVLGRDHWLAICRSASGDQGAKEYLTRHDVDLVEAGDLATGVDQDLPASNS